MPSYEALMGIFVVGYLVSILYFIGYLQRVHHRTWVNLGEPQLIKIVGPIQDQARQLRALLETWRFIFSGAHVSMEDSRLSTLVWSLRMLILGVLFSFIGAIFRRTA
jgi:hypothetical protein